MLCLFLGLAWWCVGRAQGLQTWIDELAAYRTLEQTVQSGYHLATTGLGQIGDAKEAEYQLHAGFFGSLDSVSVAVATDPALSALLGRLGALIQTLNTQLAYWRRQPASDQP